MLENYIVREVYEKTQEKIRVELEVCLRIW